MNEQLVTDALVRVFDHGVSFAIRPDTPLSVFGPIDQAWVLLAQAIADLADVNGLEVRMDDADVEGVQTFGDLVQLVNALCGTSAQGTS